jgi:hypothetical protein
MLEHALEKDNADQAHSKEAAMGGEARLSGALGLMLLCMAAGMVEARAGARLEVKEAEGGG